MNVRVAVDPALHLSLDEFATVWNADPAVPSTASVEQERSGAYNLPPELIEQGVIYLSGIATAALVTPTVTAVAAFLQEHLKAFLDAKFPKTKAEKQIEVTQVKQPDGSILLVVHEREEA